METIQMQYLTESSPPARRANFMVICPRGQEAMIINTSRRSAPRMWRTGLLRPTMTTQKLGRKDRDSIIRRRGRREF